MTTLLSASLKGASAQMLGMKIVIVACDANGNVDPADLKAKAEKHSAELAARFPKRYELIDRRLQLV